MISPALEVDVEGVVEFGILVHLVFDELLEFLAIFITFDLAGCPSVPELVDGFL